MTHRQVTEAIQRGDKTAFDQAFHLYARELNVFAFTFIENDLDAQDIVQDCFAQLLHRPNTWREITDLRVYLYTSVRNQCFLHVRRKKMSDKRRALLMRFQLDTQPDGVEPEGLQEFLRAETTQYVEWLLSSLTEKRKELLKLLYIEEKSYKQVSALLGVSCNTIKTQVRQAKKSLSKIIPLIILIFLAAS